MTALPETLLPRSIGRGWMSRSRGSRSAVRAHLHDGRLVECLPSGNLLLAVYAESTDCPAAHELAARHGVGVEQFLTRWTRAEVAAKLLGQPSLRAFRDDAARNPMLTIRTGAVDDLVVSVGWLDGRV